MSQCRFATTAVAAMLFAIPSLASKPVILNQNIEVPGADAKLKVYGSVRLDAIYDHTANHSRNNVSINAEKIRFGVIGTIPSAGYGDIHTKVEFEAKNKDNKSTVKLHDATIGFKNWLMGHTDSTFIDSEASPEMINSKGPLGEPNHDVSHVNLVRYTTSINDLTFALAVENGITYIGDISEDTTNKIYHREPTYVASVAHKFSWGHVSVRGLSQQLEVSALDTDKHSGRRGCAMQLSGSINIGKDKLVGTFVHGKGLGAYGHAAQTTISVHGPDADHDYPVVQLNKQSAWQVGYTHHWNDTLRSNIIASGINNMYVKKGFEIAIDDFGKVARDYSVNTIVKIAKNMDLGAEYVYQTKSITPAAGGKGKDHKAIVSFVARF